MHSPRLLVRALLPLVLVLLGVPLAPAPAQAGVSSLCTGYSACNKAGMSHAGYAQANGTMYWRMYAGHNCTNYVAYRLIQSGMPDVRPWDGGGNATYWGSHMSSITDQTPAVGSVAWWKAGVYPAGSAGHVAYVEKVVSADEIIVSQDSWGGDFSWARITRGSKGWPSGFIHFNDAPLVNVEKPALAGTPKVGAVLTATPGAWNPGEVQTEYRWLVDGNRLPGAAEPTLIVDEQLVGRRIKVRVIASQLGYPTAKASSTATPAVLPGTMTATVAPAVTGDSTVDGVLQATPGQWYPTPDTVSYQWTADGRPISDATQPTLPVSADLEGRSVAVQVTATREGYEPVVLAPPARTVAPGTLQLVREAALEGVTRPGQQLRLATPETVQESSTTISWLRDGQPIADVTGTTYDLTAADLGRRVSAEVTLRRPGYTALTRTVVSDRVREPAELAVAAERRGRRGGKVRVKVQAHAEASGALLGQVRIKSLGSVRVAELRDGMAAARLRSVPTRAFRVKVVIPGSLTTERAVEVVRVSRH